MLITLPYRIGAGLLASFILSISLGLVIDLHYCLGQVKSVGIYQKADVCLGDQGVEANCTDTFERSMPCCHNKTLVWQCEGDWQVDKHQITDQFWEFILTNRLDFSVFNSNSIIDFHLIYTPPNQIFKRFLQFHQFRC